MRSLASSSTIVVTFFLALMAGNNSLLLLPNNKQQAVVCNDSLCDVPAEEMHSNATARLLLQQGAIASHHRHGSTLSSLLSVLEIFTGSASGGRGGPVLFAHASLDDGYVGNCSSPWILTPHDAGHLPIVDSSTPFKPRSGTGYSVRSFVQVGNTAFAFFRYPTITTASQDFVTWDLSQQTKSRSEGLGVLDATLTKHVAGFTSGFTNQNGAWVEAVHVMNGKILLGFTNTYSHSYVNSYPEYSYPIYSMDPSTYAVTAIAGKTGHYINSGLNCNTAIEHWANGLTDTMFVFVSGLSSDESGDYVYVLSKCKRDSCQIALRAVNMTDPLHSVDLIAGAFRSAYNEAYDGIGSAASFGSEATGLARVGRKMYLIDMHESIRAVDLDTRVVSTLNGQKSASGASMPLSELKLTGKAGVTWQIYDYREHDDKNSNVRISATEFGYLLVQDTFNLYLVDPEELYASHLTVNRSEPITASLMVPAPRHLATATSNIAAKNAYLEDALELVYCTQPDTGSQITVMNLSVTLSGTCPDRRSLSNDATSSPLRPRITSTQVQHWRVPGGWPRDLAKVPAIDTLLFAETTIQGLNVVTEAGGSVWPEPMASFTAIDSGDSRTLVVDSSGTYIYTGTKKPTASKPTSRYMHRVKLSDGSVTQMVNQYEKTKCTPGTFGTAVQGQSFGMALSPDETQVIILSSCQAIQVVKTDAADLSFEHTVPVGGVLTEIKDGVGAAAGIGPGKRGLAYAAGRYFFADRSSDDSVGVIRAFDPATSSITTIGKSTQQHNTPFNKGGYWYRGLSLAQDELYSDISINPGKWTTKRVDNSNWFGVMDNSAIYLVDATSEKAYHAITLPPTSVHLAWSFEFESPTVVYVAYRDSTASEKNTTVIKYQLEWNAEEYLADGSAANPPAARSVITSPVQDVVVNPAAAKHEDSNAGKDENGSTEKKSSMALVGPIVLCLCLVVAIAAIITVKKSLSPSQPTSGTFSETKNDDKASAEEDAATDCNNSSALPVIVTVSGTFQGGLSTEDHSHGDDEMMGLRSEEMTAPQQEVDDCSAGNDADDNSTAMEV